MKNLYEKISSFDSNKPRVDLLTYAEKSVSYIEHIAEAVKVKETKYVINAIRIIRAFPNDYTSINREVVKVEAMVRSLMRNSAGQSIKLPSREFFKNGSIVIGRIDGTDTDVKLTIDQFSGNMVIYGQYGMGKTNSNLVMIPQLVSQGVHVEIFDVTNDYRDLLHIPECSGGLVFNPNTNALSVLEVLGNPDESLQSFWELTRQSFNFHTETKQLLFNESSELLEEYRAGEGNHTPTLFALRDRLKEKREMNKTTLAAKRKIDTAIGKLDYILSSFGKMVNCGRSYSLDVLDSFPLVIHEISMLSEDKRSWYIKLNLRRFYYKGLMSKERHKVKRIIVIDEAKAIFGKSVIGDASNFIKDTFTKSRSKGDAYIISDQFATELAEFTRAANCQLSFQHTVPSEIREIVTSMAGDESTRLEVPRLGKYKVLMKITDFPYPFPVVTYKSKVSRHLDDAEITKLMKDKLVKLNHEFQGNKFEKRVRVIAQKSVKQINKCVDICTKKNALSDFELFLKYVNDNPGNKVTDIYNALKLSGRKGNGLKARAKENLLIVEKSERKEGKGRPAIKLELTDKGKEYLNEKHQA